MKTKTNKKKKMNKMKTIINQMKIFLLNNSLINKKMNKKIKLNKIIKKNFQAI